MIRSLSCLVLFAAVTACGGGSSGTPIPLSSLAQKYAVAECTKLLACCAGVSGSVGIAADPVGFGGAPAAAAVPAFPAALPATPRRASPF